MKKKKIFAIILGVLSLLNFLVGGILGFVLIKGEDLKVFHFIFWLCLAAAVFCLLCSWLELRLTKEGKKYYVMKLKKWHFVKEQRQFKSGDGWFSAIEIGWSGWTLSLVVPMFALGTIWPDTFWDFSLNVYLKYLGIALVLIGVIMGIIKYRQQKGEAV